MPIETSDEFIQAIETRLRDACLEGKVRTLFSATGDPRTISLDSIQVDPTLRRSGVAGAALRLIIDLAEECGFVVEVTPKSVNGPMPDAQLVAWYGRYGFQVTRMRRIPTSLQKVSELVVD